MRRLCTLLLSFVFLLSVVHVENAQPLDDSSFDPSVILPDASEASPADAVPQTNDPSLNRVEEPPSLVGQPKWMTLDILRKPNNGPKDHTHPDTSAHEGRAFQKPTKPRGPTPTKRPRDVVELYVERKDMLARKYRNKAGSDLYFTSGQRSARKQAHAIWSNLRLYGIGYVIRLYRSGPAIREIVHAYKVNGGSRGSVSAMTRVIESQVRRGVFISNHMRWRAVDVRSRGWHRARLGVLRQVAQSMGARVSVEPNHFHVDLL